MKISANTVVTLDYEVKDPQHEMVDPGESPLVYLHGTGGIFPKLEAALDEAISRGVRDTHELQQVIRRAVGGWVGRKIRRRPMIIPTVIES